MYREYMKEPGLAVSRPRGKSPQQCAFFTRSQRLKEESSFLASVCSLLGVLPQAGTPLNQRALANLARGDELALGNCGGCGALIVSDRFAFGAPSCLHCGE
jgi:hypothetical protein